MALFSGVLIDRQDDIYHETRSMALFSGVLIDRQDDSYHETRYMALFSGVFIDKTTVIMTHDDLLPSAHTPCYNHRSRCNLYDICCC